VKRLVVPLNYEACCRSANRLTQSAFFASLRLCGKLLLIFFLAVAANAQARRPMTPSDILRIATVTDAQISPNGDWIAYTVSATEGDANRSTLWLVRASLEGRPPIRRTPSNPQPELDQIRQPPTPLLPAGWYATTPRWSPDGKSIAFLAEHEGLNGIWVVTLERRQPKFIVPLRETNFFITYAGEQFAWSPDSKSIAYISATEDSPQPGEPIAKADDPRIIDRLQYKSRTSFSDHLRTHVYFTYVDNPEPRQLTSGPYYDHALTFSPKGDEVAFLSNHESDPDANNNSDIFAVDLHGQERQITHTQGCEYEPAWSPDGKWIAYSATKRDVTTIDSVAEDTHVWVTDAAGSSRRELSNTQDRRARNPRWSSDSQTILYLAFDHGCTTVFAVSLEGGNVRQALPDRLEADQLTYSLSDYIGPPPPPRNGYQVSNFSIAEKRDSGLGQVQIQSQPMIGYPVAFTLSGPNQPPEVWLLRRFGRRISGHNESIVRQYLPMSDAKRPDEITFNSFDGTPIQGWLMKPIGFREDRKYPLILSIHGGPHGMYGWAFNPTFQVYAARGYAVLYLNPRGSSGYGQKFSDGTLNEWGGGDYRDLMAGADEALRRYTWIDQDRMGVTGGSYGGFMTNWIITQTPRFKAAVSAASVSNLISFYSTSLYQDLIHAEFNGFPWDNYDLLWQWSPLRYVKQAQTPTLFIHGEQDNDVHITQAEEMYMALKRRGIDTVLVRYPREGHGLREPKHRVDALERTLAWF
jgi:dipeptidyl aminopeptidase/acylaminoacyl peptidase